MMIFHFNGGFCFFVFFLLFKNTVILLSYPAKHRFCIHFSSIFSICKPYFSINSSSADSLNIKPFLLKYMHAGKLVFLFLHFKNFPSFSQLLLYGRNRFYQRFKVSVQEFKYRCDDDRNQKTMTNFTYLMNAVLGRSKSMTVANRTNNDIRDPLFQKFDKPSPPCSADHHR